MRGVLALVAGPDAEALTRLWREQGKLREAHELLAGIYGWFTEGFDTPDLKEAGALLVELASLKENNSSVV